MTYGNDRYDHFLFTTCLKHKAEMIEVVAFSQQKCCNVCLDVFRPALTHGHAVHHSAVYSSVSGCRRLQSILLQLTYGMSQMGPHNWAHFAWKTIILVFGGSFLHFCNNSSILQSQASYQIVLLWWYDFETRLGKILYTTAVAVMVQWLPTTAVVVAFPWFWWL